ncbi:acyltransferase [Nocardioides flavescens]|uniref:Acyltransferase n=1 Tax=Nocardioides flavescens TaxID=2691959 RepID=A0A6L7F0Z9_9ACTN|nr:acyltransferase [Nocardioides flavescens]MXG89902.1 acyltransferase [Nocardioides flavescens]
MSLLRKVSHRLRQPSRRGHQVDPSARLHPTVRLERAGVAIGARARIGGGCVLVGPLKIGDACFLNEGVYVGPDVQLAENVALGQFVRLITGTHEIGDPNRRAQDTIRKPITVGRGAALAAGVMVMPGVTIGAGAVVLAGSVVTRDVAPNALVGGSPARLVRDLSTD